MDTSLSGALICCLAWCNRFCTFQDWLHDVPCLSFLSASQNDFFYWHNDKTNKWAVTRKPTSDMCPMQTEQYHSLINRLCQHEETVLGYPKLSRENSDQTGNAQADLNLPWMHLSKGMYTDIVTQINKTKLKKKKKKVKKPKYRSFSIWAKSGR